MQWVVNVDQRQHCHYGVIIEMRIDDTWLVNYIQLLQKNKVQSHVDG